MIKSRLNGDRFEYIIAKLYYDNGLKFYDLKSETKFKKLEDKYKNNFDEKINNNELENIFNKENIWKYDKIKFTNDCDGISGNVADIELYKNNDEKIGLSCKVNNISIKHQRPSSLYKQCNFDDMYSELYKEEYKKYNDKWYENTKDKITFDKIDKDEKFKLYGDFNQLTKKYLEKISDIQTQSFYKFLISYEHIYVIHHDSKNNKISIYNYCKTKLPTKINSISIKDNHLKILFDNDININLRLHNASKTITKSLSLKYDTKVLNIDKLFTKNTYDYSLDNIEKNKEIKNKEIKNILRYPGGKSRAIKILNKYIPADIDVLYSPFFGGGSFEFNIQQKYNIKIYANDKFTPLYNFWNTLQSDKDNLIKYIKNIHPITKEQFNEYKIKLQNKDISNLERASYYFAINRSSFSGSTTSGGFSEESSKMRFNMSSIERLDKINISNIEFSNKDFTNFIDNIPDNKFIFLDPPYYLGTKSKLYGNNGDLHENFDHNELYNKLKNKKLWLLCYNNCDYIKNLYKDFHIISESWSYGMNKSKESSEILILSNDLLNKLNINKIDNKIDNIKPRKKLKNKIE